MSEASAIHFQLENSYIDFNQISFETYYHSNKFKITTTRKSTNRAALAAAEPSRLLYGSRAIELAVSMRKLINEICRKLKFSSGNGKFC